MQVLSDLVEELEQLSPEASPAHFVPIKPLNSLYLFE